VNRKRFRAYCTKEAGHNPTESAAKKGAPPAFHCQSRAPPRRVRDFDNLVFPAIGLQPREDQRAGKRSDERFRQPGMCRRNRNSLSTPSFQWLPRPPPKPPDNFSLGNGDGRAEPQTHATPVLPRPEKKYQQHTVGPLWKIDPDLRASFLQCAALFGTSDGFGSFWLEDESPNRNSLGLRRGRSWAADSGRGDREQTVAPCLSAPPSPQLLPPPPTAPIIGAKPQALWGWRPAAHAPGPGFITPPPNRTQDKATPPPSYRYREKKRYGRALPGLYRNKKKTRAPPLHPPSSLRKTRAKKGLTRARRKGTWRRTKENADTRTAARRSGGRDELGASAEAQREASEVPHARAHKARGAAARTTAAHARRHAPRRRTHARRHAQSLCTHTCGGGALTDTSWGWATRGLVRKHAQSVCTHPCGGGALTDTSQGWATRGPVRKPIRSNGIASIPSGGLTRFTWSYQAYPGTWRIGFDCQYSPCAGPDLGYGTVYCIFTAAVSKWPPSNVFAPADSRWYALSKKTPMSFRLKATR